MSLEKLVRRFETALEDIHPNSLPFVEILCEALELHSSKSKDYGLDQDPYANVRQSEDFGVPAWKGSMIRANDKIVRIKKFATSGTLKHETVEDSMIDLCVYFPIILMLYRQAKK